MTTILQPAVSLETRVTDAADAAVTAAMQAESVSAHLPLLRWGLRPDAADPFALSLRLVAYADTEAAVRAYAARFGTGTGTVDDDRLVTADITIGGMSARVWSFRARSAVA